MKHFIVVTVMIALVTVALDAVLEASSLLPPLASVQGIIIDWLFGFHLKLIVFLFALVIVFMVYSIVVFRRKAGERGDGMHIHGNTTLEIVWTVVPTIVVVYVGYLGIVTLRDVTASSPDEMVVEVTSTQWKWTFDYPEQGITSNDLVLPVNRAVRFDVTATDVIHSLWVPEFRVKQDAVPGAINVLRVTPNVIGDYKVRSAELCGVGHAVMLADVRVLSHLDFEEWVETETERLAALDTPEARGEHLYMTQGCQACHSLDGTVVVGPSWKNIFGSMESLDDGSAVSVDEAYIRNSILNPGDQIVEGFQNVMPTNFGEILSEQDVDDLIAFIRTLQD
ncbi:MAG: cytochrome c oxidase subunit II [Anaerolineales bacterium]|nr:cytochrome c oxidase subunit II [Anaerolineales bacterium]